MAEIRDLKAKVAQLTAVRDGLLKDKSVINPIPVGKKRQPDCKSGDGEEIENSIEPNTLWNRYHKIQGENKKIDLKNKEKPFVKAIEMLERKRDDELKKWDELIDGWKQRRDDSISEDSMHDLEECRPMPRSRPRVRVQEDDGDMTMIIAAGACCCLLFVGVGIGIFVFKDKIWPPPKQKPVQQPTQQPIVQQEDPVGEGTVEEKLPEKPWWDIFGLGDVNLMFYGLAGSISVICGCCGYGPHSFFMDGMVTGMVPCFNMLASLVYFMGTAMVCQRFEFLTDSKAAS